MDLNEETIGRLVELWMKSEERIDIPREEVIEAREEMHELFRRHGVTAVKTLNEDGNWVLHIYPREWNLSKYAERSKEGSDEVLTARLPADELEREIDEEGREPWEVVRDENEELIDEFLNYLREDKGLGERTVDTHAFNLSMLNEYIAGYECSRLEEVIPYDVDFFMNDWYLRKTIAGKETMLRMPVSLKKLFVFLSREKDMDVPLEEIREICDDRKLFKKRLAKLMNM